MAINGIELEVGQVWRTRGGLRAEVLEVTQVAELWPVVVEVGQAHRYTVDKDGYALGSDAPRNTDLVQQLRRDSDHAAPLPVAEPQDSNTVTSAQVNDWIEWHGGECPVGPSTPVEVRMQDGFEGTASQPGDLRWTHTGCGVDIVAYRVVNPTLHHQRDTVDGYRPGPLQTMVREAMVGIGIGERESNRVFPDISEELRAAGDVKLRGLVSKSEALCGRYFGVKPVDGVGDVNSTAKGSGARYNAGKPPYELIPCSHIAASFQHDERLTFTDQQVRALAALDALGMWQAREGNLVEVLQELGDGWDDCARVFDYGRRKYAEWNWAKGMAWSIPVACAARHLMAIIRGEANDPESGLPHVGHVFCNIVMLLTYQGTFTEGDDRPAKGMLL